MPNSRFLSRFSTLGSRWWSCRAIPLPLQLLATGIWHAMVLDEPNSIAEEIFGLNFIEGGENLAWFGAGSFSAQGGKWRVEMLRQRRSRETVRRRRLSWVGVSHAMPLGKLHCPLGKKGGDSSATWLNNGFYSSFLVSGVLESRRINPETSSPTPLQSLCGVS